MRIFTTAALAILAAPALADPGEGYYGHMGGHGLFGGVFSLLFGVLLIAAAVMAVRWFSAQNGAPGDGHDSAMRILRERLARGEIDPEEFEARRKVLENG